MSRTLAIPGTAKDHSTPSRMQLPDPPSIKLANTRVANYLDEAPSGPYASKTGDTLVGTGSNTGRHQVPSRRPVVVNYSLTARDATPDGCGSGAVEPPPDTVPRDQFLPQHRWIRVLTLNRFSPGMNEVQKAERRPFRKRRRTSFFNCSRNHRSSLGAAVQRGESASYVLNSGGYPRSEIVHQRTPPGIPCCECVTF